MTDQDRAAPKETINVTLPAEPKEVSEVLKEYRSKGWKLLTVANGVAVMERSRILLD